MFTSSTLVMFMDDEDIGVQIRYSEGMLTNVREKSQIHQNFLKIRV